LRQFGFFWLSNGLESPSGVATDDHRLFLDGYEGFADDNARVDSWVFGRWDDGPEAEDGRLMMSGVGAEAAAKALDGPEPLIPVDRCCGADLPVSSILTPSDPGGGRFAGFVLDDAETLFEAETVAGVGAEAGLAKDGRFDRILCRSVSFVALIAGAAVRGGAELDGPAAADADDEAADDARTPEPDPVPDSDLTGRADDEFVFLKLGNDFLGASDDVVDDDPAAPAFFFAIPIK
jgi:hypothetical protein